MPHKVPAEQPPWTRTAWPGLPGAAPAGFVPTQSPCELQPWQQRGPPPQGMRDAGREEGHVGPAASGTPASSGASLLHTTVCGPGPTAPVTEEPHTPVPSDGRKATSVAPRHQLSAPKGGGEHRPEAEAAARSASLTFTKHTGRTWAQQVLVQVQPRFQPQQPCCALSRWLSSRPSPETTAGTTGVGGHSRGHRRETTAGTTERDHGREATVSGL